VKTKKVYSISSAGIIDEMKKILLGKRGVTFVEVIIAAALVVVIVLSLAATNIQSSVFSKRIDFVYTATQIGQRRMDLLKRLGFDQVPSAVETDVRVDADGNMFASGNYVRTTEVDTNFGGNPSLAKVKVIVKRVKIYMDGSISDSGETTFIGQPIVMETLFSNIE
jgi:Tfp pilus assembly protein PilE